MLLIPLQAGKLVVLGTDAASGESESELKLDKALSDQIRDGAKLVVRSK